MGGLGVDIFGTSVIELGWPGKFFVPSLKLINNQCFK